MDEIKHIKKEDLEPGFYYMGWCRNTNVAKWDGKKQKFIYIRYSFDFYIDEIEHFDDVKESGFDGFIPFEKIEHPKLNKDIREYVKKIGY